jgi:hypothetical protein
MYNSLVRPENYIGAQGSFYVKLIDMSQNLDTFPELTIVNHNCRIIPVSHGLKNERHAIPQNHCAKIGILQEIVTYFLFLGLIILQQIVGQPVLRWYSNSTEFLSKTFSQ